MTQQDVDSIIAVHLKNIAWWQAALLADAVEPQPSQSVDGESVDVVAWRKGLTVNIEAAQRAIADVQKTYNLLHPYALSTRQVLR